MKTSSRNNWLLIGFCLALLPGAYAAEEGSKISEDTKIPVKTEISTKEASASSAEQIKAGSEKISSKTEASSKEDAAIKAEQIKVVSDKSDSEKNVKGSDKWALSKSAPAAPAPPFFALLAFGAVVGIRGLQKRSEAQAES
jgi:hypothetical protein